jgi:hypothetical protein
LRSGLLEDHILVVASTVPTGLPEEALDHRGDGFFTRTMTYGLQGTTQEGNKVVTESTFRRGTAAGETASYEERQAQRYDLKAIGMVYESFGFEAPKTPLELLQRPLLLKKSKFPNGIVDVLRRCDIAGDVLQDIIRERSVSEYQDLWAESARKDASLADLRAAARAGLLVAVGSFEKHEDANHLLWQLIREHAVPAAGTNHSIDDVAFGPQAATYIRQARQADAAGNYAFRDQLLDFAVEAAVVTGCGGGSCGLERVDPNSGEGKAVKGELEMKEGDKLVRDTERPCKNKDCRRIGSVYYSYDERRFNKFCSACGAKEIDGKLRLPKNKDSA